jgi:hypothetical protein
MNCTVVEGLFRDVLLKDLKRTGNAPLFLWACLFERVALSGRISAAKINGSVGARLNESREQTRARQEAYDARAREFYAISDWALDISQAEFPGGITFEAIPGDKIKRDPERQVLVTRNSLSSTAWQALDFDGTALNIALGWFERHSLFDSVVLAARSDRKWSKRDTAVLTRLRDAGIAAPA